MLFAVHDALIWYLVPPVATVPGVASALSAVPLVLVMLIAVTAVVYVELGYQNQLYYSPSCSLIMP
jgi:hypothetical protein